MSFELIGLALWGILAVLYGVAIWRLSFWTDGAGLKALRLLYGAIFVHVNMSFWIRYALLKGATIAQIAPYAMIGQVILVYAGTRALIILYRHFEGGTESSDAKEK